MVNVEVCKEHRLLISRGVGITMKAKGWAADELMDIVREECQRKNVPFPY